MEKGQDNGFIIHSRRFRENSRVLDLFTRQHGRISVLGRVSRKQALRKTVLFQSFREVSVSWRGNGSLPALTAIEEIQSYPLKGDLLLCGLYCNELLYYTLTSSIAAPDLYQFYKNTIRRLSEEPFNESSLREFELKILEESGQGLDFFHDCSTGMELGVNEDYYFQPGFGFSCREPTGQSLQLDQRDMDALQSGKLGMQEMRKGVKLVYRSAINHMLHNRSLHSRRLFKELNQLK